MSFSPLAYADSLRIGSIDFVSPDEIKVLLDIEAPDNLAMNTGTMAMCWYPVMQAIWSPR